MYGEDDLPWSQKEVETALGHLGAHMRVQNFRALVTGGEEGLRAHYAPGKSSPLFEKIHTIASAISKPVLTDLVTTIIEEKLKKAGG